MQRSGETSVAVPVGKRNAGDRAGNRDKRGNTETETRKCMIKL